MTWNPDLFQELVLFAAEAHAGQQVPGTDLPYLVHLMNVTQETLLACTADPSLDADLALSGALLHDTLEDTTATYEQIAIVFGEPVAAGVQALTKDDSLPKAERMTDSLTRIRQQPREVWLVKLADRITNLQPPPAYWSTEKRRGYLAEAALILDQLGEASPWLAGRLAGKMEVYESWLESGE